MKEGQVSQEKEIKETTSKNKTGAKTAAKVITLLALATGLTVGGIYAATDLYPNYQENKRVEQLISANTTDDLCTIPDLINIDKAYDIKYADGSKIANELTKQGIKYCEILDQYYTQDGSDIAILTYEVTTTEYIDAIKTEINGTIVYSAPNGYTLNGDICYRTTTQTMTKIVPKNPKGDYSEVVIPNVSSYELVDAQELQTKPYSDIIDYTLICDVPDDAVLNKDGYCEATLTLKKH